MLLGGAALLLCLVLASCRVPGKSSITFNQHPDVDDQRLEGLLSAIEDGRYGEVHSVIVQLDGEIVLEAYFDGHSSTERCPLYSVTKSFLSTLFGIAIKQGAIPSVHQPALGYFPEYTRLNHLTGAKRSITIEHLLTMTAGLRWDELSLPYDDPNNDYQRYLASKDRIKYVLDLPMAQTPGELVAYNTALSQVLSAILTRATGLSAAEYARHNLFGPLQITDWRWVAYDRTTSVGGAGLYLRPLDMAQLGQLYLQGGVWEGARILPAEWVRAATSTHGSVGQWQSYGYHWWRYSKAAADSYLDGHDDIYYALGRGGQYVWVLPYANAVISCTAWDDNNGYWPESMLWDFIGPAIRR